MSYKLIMFDLDGTIIDSGPGIMESVQYALTEMGYSTQPEEILRKFVGPSLVDSFTRFYNMSPEDCDKAVALYRSVYQAGNMFHLTIYPGVIEVLQTLKERDDCRAVLVTSKPYKFATSILEHYDLAQYIDFISGPELSDPSSDKSRLINRALEKAGVSKEEAVMIGDTHFDIEGANKSGVASIGVTYGYGSREELTIAGATYLTDTATGLLTFL